MSEFFIEAARNTRYRHAGKNPALLRAASTGVSEFGGAVKESGAAAIFELTFCARFSVCAIFRYSETDFSYTKILLK